MQKTLVIIKPDGVKKNLIGEIIKRFEDAGLKIVNLKMSMLSFKKAKILYKDIKIRCPKIYRPLLKYMREGKIVAMVIEGKNAVKKVGKICGKTNPIEAGKGTIRGDFSDKVDMKKLYEKGKVTKNIVHFTQTFEETKNEIKLIFDIKRF